MLAVAQVDLCEMLGIGKAEPMLAMSGPMRKQIMVPAACRERFVPIGHRALAGWVEEGIIHSGVSELVPGYHVGTEAQGAYMLIATIAGRGLARSAAAGRHELVPGTLFIDLPGGASEWATAGRAWTLVWWYLRDLPRWRALAAGGPRVVAYAHGEMLFHAMDAFIRRLAGERGGERAAIAIAAPLGDTVLAHLHELAGPGAAAGRDALATLWAEVAERLHEQWPLSHLAARLRVSVPTLQRQVRARYRASAHQVLLGLRMARAEELLRRTAYPLRVIAEQLGFADAFGFSNAFRRYRGCAPAAFRARHARAAPEGGS